MADQTVRIPEVIEPDEALPADLVALRRFAWLLDEAFSIPGTKRRFGVDAALGLIPGIGDIVAGLLSAWIIVSAVRHRVPLLKVGRMVFNVLLDVTVGAIPLFGDVFDFLFEENMINLRLLLRHRNRARPPRNPRQMVGTTLGIFAIIGGAALFVVGAMMGLVIWLIRNR
jgi:uncharacterized protein DUF4112